MTIRLLMAGVVAGLIVSSPTFAQDKASQKFLKEAIEGNLAEVQMGQLAQKNGQSDGVRSFGQMLQKDHSDANQKATAAANQMGMSPPTEPNSKQKAMYDKMSKLSGDIFDREFAKHMVADHKKDIKEYEKEAKKNDAAGAYAKEALPTLHKHLDTAQSLSGGPRPGSAKATAFRSRWGNRLLAAAEAGERLARDNTGGRSFLKLYSARQVGRSPRACGPQDRAGGASTPRPELTGSHRAVNDDQISDRTVQPQRDYFVDTRLICTSLLRQRVKGTR
jgi:putative membrane protein